MIEKVIPLIEKYTQNELIPSDNYRLTISPYGIWFRNTEYPFGFVIRELLNRDKTITVEGTIQDILAYLKREKQLKENEIDLVDEKDKLVAGIMADIIKQPERYYGHTGKLEKLTDIIINAEVGGKEIEAIFPASFHKTVAKVNEDIICIIHPTEPITVFLAYPKVDYDLLYYSFGIINEKKKGKVHEIKVSDKMLLN